MRHCRLLPLVLLLAAAACRDEALLTPAVPPATPAQPRTTLTSAHVDLRAGYDYVCRLRSGIITCFGSRDQGQPIGYHQAMTGSFVQLTAGQTHACGLRSDGAVECWGANPFGEAPPLVRAASGSFTQVSAGLGHTCAVRTDGIVECWGLNDRGQAPPVFTPQSGTFTEVTASASRTCALRSDGVVECIGYREGTPSVRALPGGRYVRLGETVGATICVLRNNGDPECWGNQPSFPAGPYAQVVVGAAHECASRSDGTVACGGYTYSWEGPGKRSVTSRAWSRVTAGSNHTCGLRPDGYFECFGLQSIGSDAPDVIPTPTTPASSLQGGWMRVVWRDVNLNEQRTEVDRSLADGAGNPTSWTRAGSAPAQYTWFTDSTVTPGATYLYRIRVCNNAGCSDWTQSNATPFPAGPPPAPAVTARGYVCGFESCAKVTWTGDNTFVDTFRVQRRVATGGTFGSWENVATTTRKIMTFDDYALTPGAGYQYRVRACNIRGCSQFGTSDPIMAPKVPPPAAPATLSAAMAGVYMHVVWGDVVNETTYELQRRQYQGTAYGAWSDPVVRTMDVTSDDQWVVAGTLYQWRIRACNQGGCSAYTYSDPTRA